MKPLSDSGQGRVRTMNCSGVRFSWLAFLLFTLSSIFSATAADLIPAPGSKLPSAGEEKLISQESVTAERVGDSIPVSSIGEPVSAVKLTAPHWVSGANGADYAVVEGAILPVDPKSKPINFRVVLPAKWSRHAAQLGGGGMNGTIPNLNRNDLLSKGFVTYGSDSGHQMGGFPGMGGPRGGAGVPPVERLPVTAGRPMRNPFAILATCR